MTNDSNKRLIGVIMLIVVSLLILTLMQGETKVKASQVVKSIREFDLGEKLILYETPQLLSEDELKAMAKYSQVEFFQSDLPSNFLEKADEQNRQIAGQRDLLGEQTANKNNTQLPNETQATESTSKFGDLQVTELTGSQTEARLIETQAQQNIFIRGSIVKVVGKVEMQRPAPYFLNVNITCCDMDSFRVMSAFETDSQGNFIIKFATTPKFPLGDWTVTISTIGDDNKIIKTFYNFKLLAPPE